MREREEKGRRKGSDTKVKSGKEGKGKLRIKERNRENI